MHVSGNDAPGVGCRIFDSPSHLLLTQQSPPGLRLLLLQLSARSAQSIKRRFRRKSQDLAFFLNAKAERRSVGSCSKEEQETEAAHHEEEEMEERKKIKKE